MPKVPKAAKSDAPSTDGAARKKDGKRNGKRPSRPASSSKSGGGTRTTTKNGGGRTRAPQETTDFAHRQVDQARTATAERPAALELNELERGLLGDLFAVIEEHDDAGRIDRDAVERAFVFSCERHADQRRQSGEGFIVHPVGVAKICAGMRLDTATLCAALLHDTVEDTSASLVEVRDVFGEEIANLVDGVTKLTGITFQSRDDRQAEN